VNSLTNLLFLPVQLSTIIPSGRGAPGYHKERSWEGDNLNRKKGDKNPEPGRIRQWD
jgi:hypothetical protein